MSSFVTAAAFSSSSRHLQEEKKTDDIDLYNATSTTTTNDNDKINDGNVIGSRIAKYFARNDPIQNRDYTELVRGTVDVLTKHSHDDDDDDKQDFYLVKYDNGHSEELSERDIDTFVRFHQQASENQLDEKIHKKNILPENIHNTTNNKNKTKSKKTTTTSTKARTSNRERKSTTITIDGHTVLTQNNYILKGHQYVFLNDNIHKSKHQTQEKQQQQKKKKNTGSNHARNEPRELSIAQQRNLQRNHIRSKHNESIKSKMVGDKEQKMHFLSRNRHLLKGFITGKVKTLLEQVGNVSAGNVSAGRKDDEVEKFQLKSQPELVETNLRDYQLIGLEWMVNMHMNGLPMILGDEMGLGKTLQTISLLAYLKEHSTQFTTGPSLVICPLSVLYSWCNEVKKHAPQLKFFRLHSSEQKQRDNQKSTLLNHALEYDIIITTYEMAKSSQIASVISNTYFNYVILDEGHIIKDSSTQISLAVRKIHSQNKLILTGTPLQNNLVELYSILNYLYPTVFTEESYFRDAFDIGRNSVDKDMLLKANKVLALFMLRRLKDEVEKLMPKKIETKIMCPLSAAQIFWYKGYLMKDIDALVKVSETEADAPVTSKYNILRNLIMQLRKCCLHPFLFKGAELSIAETTLEELIASSGKLAVLDKMLHSMFKNGNRTVIFSQFTNMLDILEDYCAMRGWKYCRFDGGTPRAQRNYLINRFNEPNSDIFIFLMVTRSGGLGINLQTADTCILYDSDWNPQPEMQAMARVHRIGQKKVVHVYRLVSSGTVEERVLERAEKKLYLDQMVNKGTSAKGADGDEKGGLTTSELLSTLKFGSNAIFSSANNLPSDDDVRAITDRNRSEETCSGLLQGGKSQTAKDFEVEKELTDTQTFGGIDFRKIRDMQKKSGKKRDRPMDKLREEWRDINILADLNGGRGKRHKKNRIMNIVDDNGTTRQVLSQNNYDLENGEPSVFKKEATKTSGMSNPKNKKKTKLFENQDYCQYCGDSGELIVCPRCPVSVHSSCCGIRPKDFASCSHHRCSHCNKTTEAAGGLLFACQSCPHAYCEDCFPSEFVRFIGTSFDRYEDLKYAGNPRCVYIHCSKQCELVAIENGDWKKSSDQKQQCPEPIDVSYAFGSNALSVQEIATKRACDLRGEQFTPKLKGPKASKETSTVSSASPDFDPVEVIIIE